MAAVRVGGCTSKLAYCRLRVQTQFQQWRMSSLRTEYVPNFMVYTGERVCRVPQSTSRIALRYLYALFSTVLSTAYSYRYEYRHSKTIALWNTRNLYRTAPLQFLFYKNMHIVQVYSNCSLPVSNCKISRRWKGESDVIYE